MHSLLVLGFKTEYYLKIKRDKKKNQTKRNVSCRSITTQIRKAQAIPPAIQERDTSQSETAKEKEGRGLEWFRLGEKIISLPSWPCLKHDRENYSNYFTLNRGASINTHRTPEMKGCVYTEEWNAQPSSKKLWKLREWLAPRHDHSRIRSQTLQHESKTKTDM